MFDLNHPDFKLTPVSIQRPYFYYALKNNRVKPIVSIVTPFYNTGKIFEETAKSVFAQSFQQWEWIIVDDGSTSEFSRKLLKKYAAADSRVRIVSQKHLGASAARNFGYRVAKAEFIMQLDSDDLLEPTTIEKLLWYLVTHPEMAFANGFSMAFGDRKYVWREGFHENSIFLIDNRTTSICMVRRSVHQRIKGYDEKIVDGFEDWDFWLKCADLGYWGHTIPEISCWYRRRGDHSKRWKNWNTIGQERFIRRAKEKYPALYKRGIQAPTATLVNLKNDLFSDANKLRKKSRAFFYSFRGLNSAA